MPHSRLCRQGPPRQSAPPQPPRLPPTSFTAETAGTAETTAVSSEKQPKHLLPQRAQRLQRTAVLSKKQPPRSLCLCGKAASVASSKRAYTSSTIRGIWGMFWATIPRPPGHEITLTAYPHTSTKRFAQTRLSTIFEKQDFVSKAVPPLLGEGYLPLVRRPEAVQRVSAGPPKPRRRRGVLPS